MRNFLNKKTLKMSKPTENSRGCEILNEILLIVDHIFHKFQLERAFFIVFMSWSPAEKFAGSAPD